MGIWNFRFSEKIDDEREREREREREEIELCVMERNWEEIDMYI